MIDLVLPKSRPTAPITGACVWRPDADPKRPMCGLLVTSRHSWVCQWHSVAWMPLDKKKRDELKAAGRPKAKDADEAK